MSHSAYFDNPNCQGFQVLVALGSHQAEVPAAFACEEEAVNQQHKTCQTWGCSQLFTFIGSAPKSMLSSIFWLDGLYSSASNLWWHFWGSWLLSWPWSPSSGCRIFSRQAGRYQGVNLPCNSHSLMLLERTEKLCQVQKSQNHESSGMRLGKKVHWCRGILGSVLHPWTSPIYSVWHEYSFTYF